MFEKFITFIRDYYQIEKELIPLHAPFFNGNEKKYVIETIDSTFVSSVGAFVDKFEEMMKQITGAEFAVATVNGTSALHIALHSIGVSYNDEVITQPLSFVATTNAISYTGAKPVFLDVDKDTMSLSPEALQKFLEKNSIYKDGVLINKVTGKKIKACVPMHSFGFPGKIEEIIKVCENYKIPVVEDSAESLGSYSNGKHTGVFGKLGIFSFNGNKTVTCGGGGAVVTNDVELGKRIKHITTTAKMPHPYEYFHDEIGFNYRMPNLNAALACAQLEQLDKFLTSKRALADRYEEFFKSTSVQFIKEKQNAKANYWLNTILLKDKKERDEFLKFTNDQKVMTRPAWQLLNTLPMFQSCQTDGLENAKWLADRIVNIPSSVKI